MTKEEIENTLTQTNTDIVPSAIFKHVCQYLT